MNLPKQAEQPILPMLAVDPEAVLFRIRTIVDMNGTVPEAAARCGMKQATLETYMRKASLPGAMALGQICAGFGVSADWVLFGRVAK